MGRSTLAILAASVIIAALGLLWAQGLLGSGSAAAPQIAKLTDEWIRKVTVAHDPAGVADMFCADGNLVGTVSQVKRKGRDIQGYFDYFARLPGIKVVSKKYNISTVIPGVHLNTAFITWTWDGLKKPITARMSFLFRDNCIFQLHSSALPEQNESLHRVSGVM